jgi:hypothetical protein
MRGFAVIMGAACLLLAPAARAEVASASHRAAAADLLRMMDIEKAMMVGVTTMADAQVAGNPTLAPYRDVILKWAGMFLTWDKVAPQLTELYAATFTESELRELTAFYKTPTGKKAMAEIPALMQKGAAIGTDLAKQHTPELERMIRERAEELAKSKPPDSGSGKP